MELTKTLDVTAEEFFTQIERSVLSDIRRATGRELTRDRLHGFKYEKRASSGGKGGTPMKVKIVEYRFPERYRVKFTYARGTAAITYEIVSSSSGSIELHYSEEFAANSTVRGISGQIGAVLYERRVRARANRTIGGIVSYIHRERASKRDNPLMRELTDDDGSSDAAQRQGLGK